MIISKWWVYRLYFQNENKLLCIKVCKNIAYILMCISFTRVHIHMGEALRHFAPMAPVYTKRFCLPLLVTYTSKKHTFEEDNKPLLCWDNSNTTHRHRTHHQAKFIRVTSHTSNHGACVYVCVCLDQKFDIYRDMCFV